MKSFVAMTSLKDSDLVSKELTNKVLDAFDALQPMLKFLNESIKG
ncbi:MAG: hypothetical protein ACXWV6_08980 [Chitinophagaceae bacterium]